MGECVCGFLLPTPEEILHAFATQLTECDARGCAEPVAFVAPPQGYSAWVFAAAVMTAVVVFVTAREGKN